jgi:hypothetical protein
MGCLCLTFVTKVASESARVSDEHQRYRGRNGVVHLRIRLR